MPRAYPEEFRRDVVEIARRNETPIAQIAKDFGISDAVIRRWLAKADVEDGLKPVARRRRGRGAATTGCCAAPSRCPAPRLCTTHR